MAFRTNIGTGQIATTGQWGPHNAPLNINNNGGITETPQNAGNVPSAGTESREGIGNDRTFSGDAYNQNASSTDAQAIGPYSPNSGPNQSNYTRAQSNSLYKQAQIGGDKSLWNLYKEEPTSGAIVSGELSTYANSLYSQLNSSYIFEGEAAPPENPRIGSVFTIQLGGSTETVALTNALPGSTPRANSRDAPLHCRPPNGVDVPCEIGTCSDGTPIGKKMSIWQGDGCNGLNGYWMMITDPVTFNKTVFDAGNQSNPRKGPGTRQDEMPIPDVEFDQTNCEKFMLDFDRRKPVAGHRDGTWNYECWLKYCTASDNGTSYATPFRPVYRYQLMYVGTDLGEIGDKKWCEFCNEYSPQNDGPSSPSRSKCSEVEGYRKWFLAAPSCDINNLPTEAHKDELWGCCCPPDPLRPGGQVNNNECHGGWYGNGQKLYKLTKVADKIIKNSADDPCDCLYREAFGPIFEDNWESITGVDNPGRLEDQQVFVTGCTEASAQEQAGDLSASNNIFIMSTGSGTAPYFDSGECAWVYDFKGAVRCIELDVPAPSGYCAAGFDRQISDRYLFEDPNRFTNYYDCISASCSLECVSGDVTPKWDIGDQVHINLSRGTGYEHAAGAPGSAAGHWENPSVWDVEATGADGKPMHAVCSGITETCLWTFSTLGDPSIPDTGTWTLDETGDCCDCHSDLPDSGYIGLTNFVSGIDCPAGSGCSWYYCWDVVAREFGGYNSSPDDIDCTWGYQIAFTGNFGDICDVTGTFPSTGVNKLYLLESDMISGDCS